LTLTKHLPVTWTQSEVTPPTTPDFLSIYLHLLRVSTSGISLLSLEALKNLTSRKVPQYMWEYLIGNLPTALAEANAEMEKEGKGLVECQEYHRGIASVLANTLSMNVAKITENKELTPNTNPNSPLGKSLNAYLDLMVSLMQHPLPEVGGRMVNTWVLLSRDPGIQKGNLIASRAGLILTAYLKGSEKINWERVEDGSHQFAELYDEVWGDKDSYDGWLAEIKGKLGVLVRIVSYIAPALSLRFLHSSLSSLPNLTAASSMPIFVDNVMHGAFKSRTGDIGRESIEMAGEIARILMVWETNCEQGIIMKIGEIR